MIHLLTKSTYVIFFGILFFITVYPLKFTFLPLATRNLLGFLGFVLFIYNHRKSIVNNKLLIRKEYLYIYGTLFLLITISLISLIYNGTNDYSYIRQLTFPLICLFTSYFVIEILKKYYHQVGFTLISKYLIGVVFFQAILSLFFFFNTEIYFTINNFIASGELRDFVVEQTVGIRLLGLGTAFFPAGVINSIALIAIACNYNYYSKIKYNWIYPLVFLLLVIIGSMMARTTLVGAFIGLIVFIIRHNLFKGHFSTILKSTLKIFCFIILTLWSISYISEEYAEILNKLLEYAFSIFYNYFETGKLSDGSTDALMASIVFPHSIKTWLIGDGLFSNPYELGYYMNVDTGYLRLLYFFGIFGLLGFILYNFIFLHFCTIKNRNNKIFFYSIFVLVLVIATKELMDIFFIISLYLFTNTNSFLSDDQPPFQQNENHISRT